MFTALTAGCFRFTQLNLDMKKTSLKMSDNPLLTDDNPRIVAFARVTGARNLEDGYADWLESMKRAAIEAGGHGVFSFEPGSVPHVNDQASFTAFLVAQSLSMIDGPEPDTSPEV